jgi:hypothetical protein
MSVSRRSPNIEQRPPLILRLHSIKPICAAYSPADASAITAAAIMTVSNVGVGPQRIFVRLARCAGTSTILASLKRRLSSFAASDPIASQKLFSRRLPPDGPGGAEPTHDDFILRMRTLFESHKIQAYIAFLNGAPECSRNSLNTIFGHAFCATSISEMCDAR